MEAVLITYNAKSMAQIGWLKMTMEQRERTIEQLLADGYKPTERFKPYTNEAYTNGVFVRVWEFRE